LKTGFFIRNLFPGKPAKWLVKSC